MIKLRSKFKQIWRKYFIYNKFFIFLISCLNKVRFRKVDLAIILWPPASEIFDEICADIEKTNEIVSFFDKKIPKESFKSFLHDIYKLDYGSLNKINSKHNFVGIKPYVLRFLRVRFNRPTIITQDILNRKKCKDVHILKERIRKNFAHKIKNYKFDMIIHSTETEKQGYKAENIIKSLNRNINGF